MSGSLKQWEGEMDGTTVCLGRVGYLGVPPQSPRQRRAKGTVRKCKEGNREDSTNPWDWVQEHRVSGTTGWCFEKTSINKSLGRLKKIKEDTNHEYQE